jgi:hypothetical protein
MRAKEKQRLIENDSRLRAMVEFRETDFSKTNPCDIEYVDRKLAGRALLLRCCGKRMIKISRTAHTKRPQGLFGNLKTYSIPSLLYCQRCGITGTINPEYGWMTTERQSIQVYSRESAPSVR